MKIKSIKTSLTLIIITVVLVPLSIIFIIFYSNITNYIEKITKEKMLFQAEKVQQRTESWDEMMTKVLDITTSELAIFEEDQETQKKILLE